jgi:hypothetical protein
MVLSRSKLIDKQLFSKHDAWLVNDVIKLAIILLKYLVIIALVGFVFVVL